MPLALNYAVHRVGPDASDLAPGLTRIAVDAKRSWDYPEAWIEAWIPDLTITPAMFTTHGIWVALHTDPDASRSAEFPAGVPVGFTVLSRPEPSDGTSTARLEHCWIDPSHQGKGLGRALFEQLLAAARDEGAKILEVVSDPNATGFYEGLGFLPCGTLRADVLGRRRELPVLRLAL